MFRHDIMFTIATQMGGSRKYVSTRQSLKDGKRTSNRLLLVFHCTIGVAVLILFIAATVLYQSINQSVNHYLYSTVNNIQVNLTHIEYNPVLHLVIDARDTGNFIQQKQQQPESNTTASNLQVIGGAFIHIGKTGGSTLSLLLKDGCHSFRKHPCRNVSHESKASQLVSTYYHVPDFGLLLKEKNNKQQKHSFYIITTRDPYDRTISAFTYEHVENRIARDDFNTSFLGMFQTEKIYMAYSCFPTLESFAQYLGINSTKFIYPYHRSQVVNTSCIDLARAAFHGHVKVFAHLFFSYRRIEQLLPIPLIEQTIYVTRQNHLWDDWITINKKFLNQSTNVFIPNNADSSSHSKNLTYESMQQNNRILEPIGRNISILGQQYLCLALYEEYAAYYRLLLSAKNINKKNVNEAIQTTHKNCPNIRVLYR